MNKSNLTNWLSSLCAILLIVVLVLQTKQKSQLETIQQKHETFASATTQRQQEAQDARARLADQMTSFGTNLESRLAQSEQQAKEKIGKMMNAVQQQTAVLHRSLGKFYPVELPEALTNKLAALETRISDEKSWPKDLTKAEAMLADLRDLVRQIPPWAEEDLLPRLNTLRWGIQSFQVLQASANVEGEDLEAAAEAYANQVSTQPDGGSTNILALLVNRQKDATTRLAVFRCESAIKDAKEQLALAVMTDGLAVWQRLSEWTNSAAHGQQVLELRKQLRSRLLEDEVAKFDKGTRASLGRLGAVTNDGLRQVGYLRMLENVTVQRLKMLEETDAPPSAIAALADSSALVEARIREETEKQRQDEVNRVRGYQQWALANIAAFQQGFMNAQKQTRPRYSVAGYSVGTETYTAYEMIRDAMVTQLLPISPAHLDTAVARIYNQAFGEGWDKLGGKDEKHLQTEVAKNDATTPKRTPQNYLER